MKNKLVHQQIFLFLLNFCVFTQISSAQNITNQLVNEYDSPYPSANPNELFKPDNFTEPHGDIDLKQALTLALLCNRDLAIYARKVRIKEAFAMQTRLLPNPEISVELEDFNGSREFHGDRQMQLTAQLSQAIQLGGKRSAAIKVTDLEKKIAFYDYELKRLEIFSQISKAFVDVIFAQINVINAQELLTIAKQTHQTIETKANAGKISTVEVSKSLILVNLSEIDFKKTKRQLITARRDVSAIWGNNNPQFKSANGTIEMPQSLPDFEVICSYIDKAPEQLKYDYLIAIKKANIDLEKANSIPDLTLSGGYRYINETEDNTLVAGVSIPFPLFNRNQGNIRASRHQLALTLEKKEAFRLKLYHDLSVSYEGLSTLYYEAKVLKENVLPEAEKSYDMVNEGFKLGKFVYLDLLDSQRTLFSVKNRINETLADYYKQLIDIESLIGVSTRDTIRN